MMRFLFVLSVNLISKYWFFAEGERFFMFLFQSPSIFPLNRFIRLHGVNHNQPFPTANQELIWSVSSFFLWLLMVKMSDF